jgi:hypothetical protein
MQATGHATFPPLNKPSLHHGKRLERTSPSIREAHEVRAGSSVDRYNIGEFGLALVLVLHTRGPNDSKRICDSFASARYDCDCRDSNGLGLAAGSPNCKLGPKLCMDWND